ncbi:hypothetical protein [Streptomyces diastatochromogenes]|uniref:Uncharacterized protein n=1 Tax=Streptomyces diastatochromogenes TaxID=42236 RepID=A0A233S189_STRDA|nr:hypothetical protein [Streptomyces diastatochromogenes]OXY89422.1 hypothetical protein BEK98_38275 [Streptomyces diastatochromogenes]
MSGGAYSFLPWLRSGIVTHVTEPPTAPSTRATIPVKLVVSGDPLQGSGRLEKPVERRVQLYGPGDVVGVDPRAISRTEPRPWVTNVEPNYLAHIEFYEEDFLWRYSPAAPEATGRLKPWLALIVLEGPGESGEPGEFTEGAGADLPLPFVTVTDPARTLPHPDQLGAWAHVHVSGELDGAVVSDEQRMPAVLNALRAVLRDRPDDACCRLLCPRHLLPNRPYHAFLVPAFETGRLSGLGLPPVLPPDADADFPAWGRGYPNQPAAGQLPYYHRWFFATGAAGDFEYLVRQLVPERPDPRVARRDVDVRQRPGANLPPIDTPEALGGVLKLGGALRVPGRKRDVWDNWDGWFPAADPSQPPPAHPHPFQEALAGLVNLADAYLDTAPAEAHARLAAADPGGAAHPVVPGAPEVRMLAGQVDPVVTPPLYGKWHAATSRLLRERDGTPIPEPRSRNWVHRLNLDPRFRIAANFGTQVVQARQEEFMAAAWAQVGEVLEANKRIRQAQLAREVGHALQKKHLDPPATSSGGAALAPAARSGRALRLTAPAGARVTPVPTGAALLASDGRHLAVGFQLATSRVGSAPVSPAMRRITRPGSRLMRTLAFGTASPDELPEKMDRDTGAVTPAPAKATPSAVVTAQRLEDLLRPHPPTQAAADDPDEIRRLKTSAQFVVTLPREGVVPPAGGDHDSPEAARFKDGLRDLYRARADAEAGARARERDPLGVDQTVTHLLTGLRSDLTVPRDLFHSALVPERLRSFTDRFLEVMAYPVIDLPMFQSLIDMSVDTFVPNLRMVPPNTVTLLETDREFIESFMVGLNHEMARELLWREYPTDQRGTPFRQFWDPRPALPLPGESAGQRRERLYDLTPVADWDPDSPLGTHDNRDQGSVQEQELVLVIRGDLLKKYPTAAIYAHAADWDRGEDGAPHPERERVLAAFPDSEHPPPDKVRLPIYEAKVEPDITLLGFDLTAEAARGRVPDDPGWFFVIKERPGDPRFGADEEGQGTDAVEVWNDLSWNDIDPGGTRFITLDPAVRQPLAPFDGSEDDQEKEEQRREDVFLPRWDETLGSADIAYMLFQAPVLIAVHAQEMLLDAAE